VPRHVWRPPGGVLLGLSFTFALVAVLLFSGTAFGSANVTSKSLTFAFNEGPFTLYAVPVQHQFVNNADDRARGQGNNPFGNYSTTFVAPPANEKLFGPFAGDEADFSFGLYNTVNAKNRVGVAIFLCQYNFNEGAFCDGSFQLKDGTLIGKGAYNFNATTFSLAIIGGTNSYRDLTGTVKIVTSGSTTQAPPVYRVSPMLESQRLEFVTGMRSRPASDRIPTGISVYTTPTQQTFVDNNDDEARGDVNNPFGTYNNNAATIIGEHQNGPFPGDETLFGFDIDKGRGLHDRIGSAVYTCQYYFDKNAFCDASFQINNEGTLVGAGTFNFNARRFILAITGGYGTYAGAKGEVAVSPDGNRAQRVTFTLN